MDQALRYTLAWAVWTLFCRLTTWGGPLQHAALWWKAGSVFEQSQEKASRSQIGGLQRQGLGESRLSQLGG